MYNNGVKSYAEVTASKKVAPTASHIASAQAKHLQYVQTSGVHLFGESEKIVALVAVKKRKKKRSPRVSGTDVEFLEEKNLFSTHASQQSYAQTTSGTSHAFETASVAKQPGHPPSLAERDPVLGGGFPSIDPYYQKYGEPTSGHQAELNRSFQTEKELSFQRATQKTLSLEYYGKAEQLMSMMNIQTDQGKRLPSDRSSFQASQGKPNVAASAGSYDGKPVVASGVFNLKDVEGAGSQASYRQLSSDVLEGRECDIQFGWDDEEPPSDHSHSGFPGPVPDAFGQTSYQQHPRKAGGKPCDVQFGLEEEKRTDVGFAEASADSVHDAGSKRLLGRRLPQQVRAQSPRVSLPAGETVYPESYQHSQYDWNEEASQGLSSYHYGTAETSDDGCICQRLMYQLQDWCNMTHGEDAPPEVQIASIPNLLDFLVNSFGTSQTSGNCGRHSIDPRTGQIQINPDDIPVCPEHGFPDLSALSQCDECATQYTYVNSLLAGVFQHRVQVNQCTTPVDKETREANEALARLKEEIDHALKVAAENDRRLDETVMWMDAQKEQMERALESHVSRLHGSVDKCHQIAVGDFTRQHNHCRAQVEKEKKKVEKFSGDLSDMQTEIEDKFTEIKTQGLAATKTVRHTQSKYYILLARKPEIQMPVKPTYSFKVPQYTDQQIASMVGCIKMTENFGTTISNPHPPISNSREPPRLQPTTTTANSRDTVRAQPNIPTVNPLAHAATGTVYSTGGSMHSAVRTGSGLLVPAASMESLDPYFPYMQKNATSSSLGHKDKMSSFMASTSSVASSASSKTPNKMKASRTETQADYQEHYGYFGQDAAERPGPKPQTIAVKQNSSPNIVRLKVPEPVAIAPTDNGNVWMVYGPKNPHLHRMDGSGRLQEDVRVGGNAMAVACLDSERILMASHSPRVHLVLVDENRKQSDVLNLKFVPISVSVGKTGLVVAGHTALCWVSLPGWKTHWIVPEKNSPLKKLCATAVTFLQEDELICAADKLGKAVHFYLKDDTANFSTLRPYYGLAPMNPGQGLEDTLADEQFIPSSMSAHPGGFVAILDSVSNSVHVLNVEHSHQAVSVIPGSDLYRSGIPSLIAFGYSDSSDARLKLWTVGKLETGQCFVSHTPLKFKY